jgi:drug/metabolite transporter (DMT)-like permease
MSTTKILGIVLLVGGILGLAYGGFTYTKSSSEVDLGIVAVEVQEQEHVNIPLWVGIGLAVAGGALLLVPSSKS